MATAIGRRAAEKIKENEKNSARNSETGEVA